MTAGEAIVKCPFCGGGNISPHGRNASGKRVYHCKNPLCSHKYFVEEYTKNGFNPEVRRKALELVGSGRGTRATARMLGISKNTVTAIMKRQKLGCSR